MTQTKIGAPAPRLNGYLRLHLLTAGIAKAPWDFADWILLVNGDRKPLLDAEDRPIVLLAHFDRVQLPFF